MLVSIVIPNHNYGHFVGAAIDSALALDWPNVEVIVVDDGSTDHSSAVIASYESRIAAIYQQNRGQSVACHVGFERSRGEVVIFLDSDDKLEPSLMRELSRVWRPGISKVQYQMKIIDAEGKPTGALLPQFGIVPTPASIKRWVSTSGGYPTPPGSGNAYAREFLKRIFPIASSERFSDSHCLAAAPYLGDIVTIAKPLVAYRVHGRNAGAMSKVDPSRFVAEVSRATSRFEYSRTIAQSVGIFVPKQIGNRNLSVLPYRLASFRLARARHPIEADSVAKILQDLLKAFVTPQGVTLKARLTLLAWATAVAASPLPISERLILWRFASQSRPKALTALLRRLRIVSSAPATG